MTEDEARTRWCPFVRELWTGGVEAQWSGNRYFNEDRSQVQENVSCLGSRCMAWRWDSQVHRSGFCGLAGKPEFGT